MGPVPDYGYYSGDYYVVHGSCHGHLRGSHGRLSTLEEGEKKEHLARRTMPTSHRTYHRSISSPHTLLLFPQYLEVYSAIPVRDKVVLPRLRGSMCGVSGAHRLPNE